jgi:S-disulfanyl-L-cysteine oxidoreductase SoxD
MQSIHKATFSHMQAAVKPLKMKTRVRITISLTLFLAITVQAQQPASVGDGVYTSAQSDRGKALYRKECASCHGADLDGTGQAPPLAGAEFKSNWNGQTLDDLFEKIQTSMPADRPGQLSREQNADILAFLLKSNEFPAGQKDLPSDAAALAKIRFTQK